MQPSLGIGQQDPQHRTGAPCRLLPGHQIGMVLQTTDHDLVAWLQPGGLSASGGKPVGHHVQRVGGTRGEHQFMVRSSADKALETAARALERIGGTLAQVVHTAVDVGPVLLLKRPHGIQHRQRHLGGGCVVEVSQCIAVDALVKDRELATHRLQRMKAGQQGITHVGPPVQHGSHGSNAGPRLDAAGRPGPATRSALNR